MIIKSFELNKLNVDKTDFILFYGKNEGLKSETIKKILKNKSETINYDEKEILDKPNNFIESILSQSLFNNEKVIVIKRSTDKIFKIINEIEAKDISDTKIFIIADNLEKKSKLRSFFEKSDKHVCIPFYEDSIKSLGIMASNFFKERNIPISSANINLIVNKCSGDRLNLTNELEKIELFCKKEKKITLPPQSFLLQKHFGF